jgi:hypothetical protein
MAELPALPASFSRRVLEAHGFVGWQSWDQLRASRSKSIPPDPAAYVVYRRSVSRPVFLDRSPAGQHKGQDSTESVDVLWQHWVPEARVMNIGKADVAKKRLSAYGRFGAGRNSGHRGGRYIWQLADSAELLVAWHPIDWEETAEDYEKRLIKLFRKQHNGMRPFANLKD